MDGESGLRLIPVQTLTSVTRAVFVSTENIEVETLTLGRLDLFVMGTLAFADWLD